MEGFDDFEQDLVAADGQTLPSGGYGEQTETDFGGQDAFFMDQGQAIPEYSNNDNSGFGADEYASQQPADATGGFGTFGSLPTETAPPADAPPAITDARIAWRAQNATLLAKKDAEEQVAKRSVEAAAQEFLKEFYEKRAAHVVRAKQENREIQEAAKLKPTGDSAWSRVMSLIDFKFDSGRQKEVERERFKNLLFTAKEKKVPVHPAYHGQEVASA